MKKLLSLQRDVRFIWCGDPITLDKRKSWGDNEDNYQLGQNGAFLKMKSDTEVNHLVQPNEDKSAPVGWIKGSGEGFFDKCPIYLIRRVDAGETVALDTLDGKIVYEVKEPSAVVCNEKDGAPDLLDQWVQKMSDIEKNYIEESCS